MNPVWIGTGNINPSDNSLPPELFRRTFSLEKLPASAELRVTALGVYEAGVNGQKIGDAFFTPGYTHYPAYVQEQRYDVLPLLHPGENTLDVMVANGWYLGQVGNRNNRYGDHRGVRALLSLTYADGGRQDVATDDQWQWTTDTPERYADFYNGETIDGTRADESAWQWRPVFALHEALPEVQPHAGAFVRVQEELRPVCVQGDVYDFGQNHAGLLQVRVKAARGTVITVRHAEILDAGGKLFTANLRGARQTLTLICGQDGENLFSPRFTFMGFRYAEITADGPVEILDVFSRVLTADCPVTGSFYCSNPLLNRLYQNTQWGQASNFVDIPTDCPQRDERMGWTGDIAVFAETAALNRDVHDFMRKWLRDLRLEQRENGAIPVVIPENPTYQPTREVVPIAIWGDAAAMVPWAVYRAYGDLELLREQYGSIKALADAELRAAAAHGEGLRKYLWDENEFQYGDWCAPREPYEAWIAKGNDLATPYMANTVRIAAESAAALGLEADAAYYRAQHQSIQRAFEALCMEPDGRLKAGFASHYVCALYFGLIPENQKAAAAARLAELVRANGHRIMTGFAGTPYLLFALADNGYVEDAYRVLLNEDCPGWLFTVKAGATTMWERWDALNADGTIKADTIPDMVSFNHYAYGAVGAFFYRRVLGIEALSPGFDRFRVSPLPGGGLTWAEGGVRTRKHGLIHIRWNTEDGGFSLSVTVPKGTLCEIVLPGGERHMVEEGKYSYRIDKV